MEMKKKMSIRPRDMPLRLESRPRHSDRKLERQSSNPMKRYTLFFYGPTPYATSLRRTFLVYHHAMKHPHINITYLIII